MAATVDMLLRSVFPSYGLVGLIYDKVAGTDVNASSETDLAAVRAETERQENEMRRLEAQAKVAQEMAIATRIERAAEVQIEEFYDYSGEGKAGLNVDDKAISLGASGSGRRVCKRVYRFTGSLAAPIANEPSNN